MGWTAKSKVRTSHLTTMRDSPDEISPSSANKYLRVLVAAKYARVPNEMPWNLNCDGAREEADDTRDGRAGARRRGVQGHSPPQVGVGPPDRSRSAASSSGSREESPATRVWRWRVRSRRPAPRWTCAHALRTGVRGRRHVRGAHGSTGTRRSSPQATRWTHSLSPRRRPHRRRTGHGDFSWRRRRTVSPASC
jgi:hypothetical protein